MAESKKPEAIPGAASQPLAAGASGSDPLASEVAALRSDLADLAQHVRRIGTVRAEGFRSAAGAKAAEGIAKGEAVVDGISDQLSSLEHDIVTRTRERPWQSLGIAAAVGYLFALIMRR